MRVVILDNWISPARQMELTGRDILVYHITNGKCEQQNNRSAIHSHGTVCSSILSEFLPPWVDVVGISCADGEKPVPIENLCTALLWCLDDPPDYLCMSIGTCNWLEANQICRLTQILAMKGTHIFAACENGGCFTFPAMYPWVTGVRYAVGKQGMFREKKPNGGYNIIVGYFMSNALDQLAIQDSFFAMRSNSMAAPYALAQLLALNKHVDELPLWIDDEPLFELIEFTMPVIALNGPLTRMKELLALMQNEGYQTLLLTDRQETDWLSMVLFARSMSFVKWSKALGKAGMLLLDSEGELNGLRKYADYSADLQRLSAQIVLKDVLKFFGATEENCNEEIQN